MARGRVDETPVESWRERPEEARVETPKHEVFICVDSNDQWERRWWFIKNFDTRRAATGFAEELAALIKKHKGIEPERLED